MDKVIKTEMEYRAVLAQVEELVALDPGLGTPLESLLRDATIGGDGCHAPARVPAHT